MMQLSLPLLLCQCAIFLISLEGIVCSLLLDFVAENFGSVDIYSRVVAKGTTRRGKIYFKKVRIGDGGQKIIGDPERVVEIRDILRNTLVQDPDDRKVVSFSVQGTSGIYKIKFNSAKQAELFIEKETPLTPYFSILWGRLYSKKRPVNIAYDEFDTGDMGFKILDNGQLTKVQIHERLTRVPYTFMRSNIVKEIRTSPPNTSNNNEMMTRTGPSKTVYLRNETLKQDYMIEFKSVENLNTFLELFPEKTYNEYKTRAYYIVPGVHDGHDASTSTSRSHNPSESEDQSKSDNTSK